MVRQKIPNYAQERPQTAGQFSRQLTHWSQGCIWNLLAWRLVICPFDNAKVLLETSIKFTKWNKFTSMQHSKLHISRQCHCLEFPRRKSLQGSTVKSSLSLITALYPCHHHPLLPASAYVASPCTATVWEGDSYAFCCHFLGSWGNCRKKPADGAYLAPSRQNDGRRRSALLPSTTPCTAPT